MYTHTFLISLLAGLAASSPIETRQLIGGTGSSSSEFSSGGCRDVLFAWARGSTEIGNMVRSPYLHNLTPKRNKESPSNIS
jgi:cutinase